MKQNKIIRVIFLIKIIELKMNVIMRQMLTRTLLQKFKYDDPIPAGTKNNIPVFVTLL